MKSFLFSLLALLLSSAALAENYTKRICLKDTYCFVGTFDLAKNTDVLYVDSVADLFFSAELKSELADAGFEYRIATDEQWTAMSMITADEITEAELDSGDAGETFGWTVFGCMAGVAACAVGTAATLEAPPLGIILLKVECIGTGGLCSMIDKKWQMWQLKRKKMKELRERAVQEKKEKEEKERKEREAKGASTGGSSGVHPGAGLVHVVTSSSMSATKEPEVKIIDCPPGGCPR